MNIGKTFNRNDSPTGRLVFLTSSTPVRFFEAQYKARAKPLTVVV